jgi:hypothetical protein
MTAPEVAGQRFLASGEFLWLREIVQPLRANLADEAAEVPTRKMPDTIVRLAAKANPQMAQIRASLRRRPRVDSSKADKLLGWFRSARGVRDGVTPRTVDRVVVVSVAGEIPPSQVKLARSRPAAGRR